MNATGFILESAAPFFTLPFLLDDDSPPLERLEEEEFELDDLVFSNELLVFLFSELPVMMNCE